MDQRTHTWIAIRAIALLEDEKKEKNLVELLKLRAREASVGAWIPDDIDAKRGSAGSRTENHVLKIEPYKGGQVKRFVAKKTELLGRIGMYRMMAQFLKDDSYLDDEWWSKPYKGDVTRAGQHIPNRAMAMSTMMKDLLLMGNVGIDQLIPGQVRFIKHVDSEARTTEEAAVTYFFMLSHFIADACMPCHCDARKLAGYAEGLHEELEKHWSKKVGTKFDRDKLLAEGSEQALEDGDEILQEARNIDTKFDLDFDKTSVTDLHKGSDVWLEVMNVCRATFAVASIIAPYKQYKYDDTKARAPFDTILGAANQQLLAELDKAVMYDSVLNTAIIWKHVWNKVSKE